MKNKYILILLLALTGCKYPFDLDQKDVKPMAVVRAYMCADSAVTINIHKIVPLSQLVTADTTLINPCYSLRCNGMEVDVDAAMIGEGGMAIHADAFKSGDKIELVFESDDTETAVAGTVIPGNFPEYELELCKSNNAERNLKIRYKDDPDTDDWYGAVVKWNGIQVMDVGLMNPKYKEVTDQDIVPPSGYNDMQLEPEAYSPIILSFNGDYLYIWKDSEEEDNEYDLSFNYRPRWDGYVAEVKDTEIQCTLFKLSEEMYRYLFAQFDRKNNPFKDAGLSSPAFTYSNVRNGVGYLCGYSMVRSEWIMNNLFEE